MASFNVIPLFFDGSVDALNHIVSEMVRSGDLATYASFRRACKGFNYIGHTVACSKNILSHAPNGICIVTSLDELKTSHDIVLAFGTGVPGIAAPVARAYRLAHQLQILVSASAAMQVLIDLKNSGIAAGATNSAECMQMHSELVAFLNALGLLTSLNHHGYSSISNDSEECAIMCNDMHPRSANLWYARGACLSNSKTSHETYEKCTSAFVTETRDEDQYLMPFAEAVGYSAELGLNFQKIVDTCRARAKPFHSAFVMAHLRGALCLDSVIADAIGEDTIDGHISNAAMHYMICTRKGNVQELTARIEKFKNLLEFIKTLTKEETRAKMIENFMMVDIMNSERDWHSQFVLAYMGSDSPLCLLRSMRSGMSIAPTTDALKQAICEKHEGIDLLGLFGDVCECYRDENMSDIDWLLSCPKLRADPDAFQEVARALAMEVRAAKYALEESKVVPEFFAREELMAAMFQAAARAGRNKVLIYMLDELKYHVTAEVARQAIGELLDQDLTEENVLNFFRRLASVIALLCFNQPQEIADFAAERIRNAQASNQARRILYTDGLGLQPTADMLEPDGEEDELVEIDAEMDFDQ